MSEENLYNLPDEAIEKIDKEISHAEIDAETPEQMLDLVFPGASPEAKAKIAIFAATYYESFLDESEE